MGNSNSNRDRRRRRRRPRHRAQRPARQVQVEYDEHKQENAPHEEQQIAERLSRARSFASEASNLKRFRVEKWDAQNPGFTVDKVSLMILDVLDLSLQEKRLPPGSIIREIDRVPVYDYSQFRTHIENKSHYILSVLVPGTTGIWKVRPNSRNRHIDVHRESLVVSTTTLNNFPKTPQVVLCVNGVRVRDFVEYQQLTHNKDKFFVTLAPANSNLLSDSSITCHLETLQQFPQAVSEKEVHMMRMTIQEALRDVQTALALRRQVIPPQEEAEVIAPKYPPAPPAAAFSQTQVPHDVHVEQAAIGDDLQNEQEYVEQKAPMRRKRRKKTRRRRRNR